MFKVIVAMVMVAENCQSFEEAFRKFYTEVSTLITKRVSMQVLETACFIQYTFSIEGDPVTASLGFYDCCDLAGQIGLLSDDGKLEKYALRSISDENVQIIFLRSTTREILGVLKMADEIREVTLAK